MWGSRRENSSGGNLWLLSSQAQVCLTKLIRSVTTQSEYLPKVSRQVQYMPNFRAQVHIYEIAHLWDVLWRIPKVNRAGVHKHYCFTCVCTEFFFLWTAVKFNTPWYMAQKCARDHMKIEQLHFHSPSGAPRPQHTHYPGVTFTSGTH